VLGWRREGWGQRVWATGSRLAKSLARSCRPRWGWAGHHAWAVRVPAWRAAPAAPRRAPDTHNGAAPVRAAFSRLVLLATAVQISKVRTPRWHRTGATINSGAAPLPAPPALPFPTPATSLARTPLPGLASGLASDRDAKVLAKRFPRPARFTSMVRSCALGQPGSAPLAPSWCSPRLSLAVLHISCGI
jgi:hypothetical protein